jgi:hypothetical protein
MYKDFDIERAMKGDPVCTEFGEEIYPARIICWDRIDKAYPIFALYKVNEHHEEAYAFSNDGTGCTGKARLLMVPVKREEWILISSPPGGPGTGINKKYELGQGVYSSEKEANDSVNPTFPGWVKAVKIREWEE